MGVLGRARVVDPPTSTPTTCVACGITGGPIESLTYDGVDITICLYPTPCRRRCEQAGTWKQ